MKYVLSRVFSLPRNAYSHQENKNKVGSFIYGTFGLLDLVTIMQAIDMEKMKNSFKQKASMRTSDIYDVPTKV